MQLIFLISVLLVFQQCAKAPIADTEQSCDCDRYFPVMFELNSYIESYLKEHMSLPTVEQLQDCINDTTNSKIAIASLNGNTFTSVEELEREISKYTFVLFPSERITEYLYERADNMPTYDSCLSYHFLLICPHQEHNPSLEEMNSSDLADKGFPSQLDEPFSLKVYMLLSENTVDTYSGTECKYTLSPEESLYDLIISK